MSQKQAQDQREDTNADPEVAAYRCSQCSVEYDHELLARVHMSRSDDEQHKNLNGMMPEAEVLAVDSQGDVIERVRTHPKELNVQRLKIHDFPDEYSEAEQRALLIAAYTYNRDIDYRELEDRINGVLREDGKGELPFQKLKGLLKQFYQPQNHEGGDEEAGEITPDYTKLRELTPRQISIIIGLLGTDKQKKTLANNIVGCTKSYPSSVASNRDKLIASLEARLQDGSSMEDILAEELTQENILDLENYAESVVVSNDEDLAEITSVEAYFDQLNVDWEEVKWLKRTERREELSEAPPKGLSSKRSRVMSATPPLHDEGEESSGDEEDSSATADDATSGDEKNVSAAVEEIQESVSEESGVSTIDESSQPAETEDDASDPTEATEQEQEQSQEQESSQEQEQSTSDTTATPDTETEPEVDTEPEPEGESGTDTETDEDSRATVSDASQSADQGTGSVSGSREQAGTSKQGATSAAGGAEATTAAQSGGTSGQRSQPESSHPGTDSTPAKIPVDDLTVLQSNVEFALDTLEREIDMGNSGATRAKAIVEKIHTTIEGADSDGIPREKIVELQSHLQFIHDTLEGEVEMGNSGATRAKAMIERLNDDFETILSS